MTYPTSSPSPAGWYPDPRDRRVERWFDGVGWSNHVRVVDDAPPVVPYDAGTGRAGRSSRARKAAAVPVSVLAIGLALKVTVLAANLVGEARENARHDAAPPSVVTQRHAARGRRSGYAGAAGHPGVPVPRGGARAGDHSSGSRPIRA